MQKCESRTKRVMSAIIAGMMALQVVAPTISYADDTIILDSPFLQQQPPIKRLRWATIPRLSCRTTR